VGSVEAIASAGTIMAIKSSSLSLYLAIDTDAHTHTHNVIILLYFVNVSSCKIDIKNEQRNMILEWK
jgi:hypothetical protein